MFGSFVSGMRYGAQNPSANLYSPNSSENDSAAFWPIVWGVIAIALGR
jgi:hypothetical protein